MKEIKLFVAWKIGNLFCKNSALIPVILLQYEKTAMGAERVKCYKQCLTMHAHINIKSFFSYYLYKDVLRYIEQKNVVWTTGTKKYTYSYTYWILGILTVFNKQIHNISKLRDKRKPRQNEIITNCFLWVVLTTKN